MFGSVIRGDDREGSDLDLLVDASPGTTLFDLGGLQADLEEALGVRVDLLTPDDSRASTSGSQAGMTTGDLKVQDYVNHLYFDINLEIVWDTIQTSLSDLERQLKDAKI